MNKLYTKIALVCLHFGFYTGVWAFQIEINDPVADDFGNGNVVYPVKVDFHVGDLDLTGFKMEEGNDDIALSFKFKNAIRNPERVNDDSALSLGYKKLDFYQFNIDVYIKLKNMDIVSTTSVPGRKLSLSPGWNKAMIISPAPGTLRESLANYWDELQAQDTFIQKADKVEPSDFNSSIYVVNPGSVKALNKKLKVSVPKSFMPSVASVEYLSVVVTGFEPREKLLASSGMENGFVRNVNVRESQDGSFNVRGEYKDMRMTNVIDILYPEEGAQTEYLSKAGIGPVAVPMLNPAGIAMSVSNTTIETTKSTQEPDNRPINGYNFRDRLVQIKSLYDEGLITQEEYLAKRTEILKSL